jgi:hypothetical protein
MMWELFVRPAHWSSKNTARINRKEIKMPKPLTPKRYQVVNGAGARYEIEHIMLFPNSKEFSLQNFGVQLKFEHGLALALTRTEAAQMLSNFRKKIGLTKVSY